MLEDRTWNYNTALEREREREREKEKDRARIRNRKASRSFLRFESQAKLIPWLQTNKQIIDKSPI